MPQLLELPEEIQAAVVGALYDIDPPSLGSLGLSCTQFRRLSKQLQWEQVQLTWRLSRRAPITRFFDIHHGNTDIRCIRLHPQRSIMNAFRINMAQKNDHVPALQRCLASLVNLTTFSIYLDGQVDRRCYLPGSALCGIVRALPPSLVHLEVDTEGVDRMWETAPVDDAIDHLCSAIGNRLADLHTLSLRISSICSSIYSGLLPPKSRSKLRRAYIRLDISPDNGHNIEVPAMVTCCKNAWPNSLNTLHFTRAQDSTAREQVIQGLVNFRCEGVFPNLERFLLYAWRSYEIGQLGRHERGLRVFDVADCTDTLFPSAEVNCDVDVSARLFKGMELGPLYLTLTLDGQHYFGDREGIEKAVLYEVQWAETPAGMRVPPKTTTVAPALRLAHDFLMSAEDVWNKQDMLKQEMEHTKPLFDHPRKFLPTDSILAGHEVKVIKLQQTCG